MKESAQNGERSVTLNRVIEGPRKRVFEAFLNPEDLAVWTPPPGFEAEVEDVEPEEGGTFRIKNRGVTEQTEPQSHTFKGTFPELREPEKIVFTDESWIEMMGDDAKYTLAVTLEEIPDGTEVTMRCEDLPQGGEDQAAARWGASLEILAEQVEA